MSDASVRDSVDSEYNPRRTQILDASRRDSQCSENENRTWDSQRRESQSSDNVRRESQSSENNRRESQSTEDSFQLSDDDRPVLANNDKVNSTKETGYVDNKAQKMMVRVCVGFVILR